MGTDETHRLSMPLMLPGTAQKHVIFNEALIMLDTLVQLTVKDRTRAEIPESPAGGDCHIVPVGAGTAWGGPENAVAMFDGTAWRFLSPRPGWRAFIQAESAEAQWQDDAWRTATERTLRVNRLGVHADPDETNRLAVSAQATLLNHAGAGHQLKVNKAAPTDTATLLFQSNWSGRAEIGLAGDDDFSIKISADGTTWAEALRLHRDTGLASGLAVTHGAADGTVGRLMKVGDFGLGQVGDGTIIANLDDPATPSGEYRYVTTLSAGTPPAAVNGYVKLSRYQAGYLFQCFIREEGSLRRVWTREYRSTAWTAWERVLRNHNILGSVSQAGGVPRGAVIERGSNANGQYVRWADGTQIAWSAAILLQANIADGACFRSNTAQWTYPAAFVPLVTAPCHISVSGGAGNPLMAAAAPSGPSNSSAAIRAFSTTSIPAATEHFVSATGRWF